MGKFVYDALCILFGGNLAQEMGSWMKGLYDTILSLVNGSLVSTAMTIFAAIACSMLTLYFFMDLVDQAKRDMFSFEKLIVSFIKFLAAFVVLLCLKDIVVNIVQIGRYLYLTLESGGSGTLKNAITSGSANQIKLFPSITRSDYYTMPTWTKAQSSFESEFKGILAFIKDLQVLIICSIASIIGFIAKIAGYFICTSNAIMIIARIAFCPIGVVQLFEDGTRSAGMRYLKSLAADCISMAVIIVILYAASALTSGLLTTSLVDASGAVLKEINFTNLDQVITLKNLALVLVPELAAVGGMAAGSKIAHDIMGA